MWHLCVAEESQIFSFLIAFIVRRSSSRSELTTNRLWVMSNSPFRGLCGGPRLGLGRRRNCVPSLTADCSPQS